MARTSKIIAATLLLGSTALLGACASTSPGASTREGKINAVLERAHDTAARSGQTEESLAILEQMYKRNSGDSETALRYARALRKEGFYNRAELILRSFATSPKLDNSDIAVEYASIQAAMGNYSASETAARQAVILAPESGQSYHVLGIALDAQGHHEEGQIAFQKGLDHWIGDPSPILNNIGLNLAAQGFLDEAVTTLRKALETAPNRTEIERNLRIVSALQYQPPTEGTRLIPRPPRKPENFKVSAIKAQDEARETVKAKMASEKLEAVPIVEVEQVETATGKAATAQVSAEKPHAATAEPVETEMTEAVEEAAPAVTPPPRPQRGLNQ